jgi:hypothetical protein
MEANNKSVLGILGKTIENLEKRHQRLKNVIMNFKKKGCSTDPWSALSWLQSNNETIAKEAPEIIQLKDQLNALCEDLTSKFDTDFRNAVSSQGLLVSGQWPRYFINHILPVAVDETKQRVHIGEDPPTTPSIEKLIRSIESQLKILKPDPKKLADFLKEVYIACKELTSPANRTVAVWDLYKQIVINRQSSKFWRNASSNNFRPFRELDFKAYITELLKVNLTSISEQQLRLHPPIQKGDSMYIYQPAENRFSHVGRVEFMPIAGG